MLDTLHLPDFLPHLNSLFHLTAENGTTATIKLVEAKDLSIADYQEQFSLHFLAPSEFPPAQGIYHLKHDALGDGDIFLVPVQRVAEGFILEAIYNRPRTEPARG